MRLENIRPSARKIAQVCHEALSAWCRANGDNSQKSWDNAETWLQQSTVEGVVFCMNNPNAPASANHDAWMAAKLRDGWVHGLVKDSERKTHPCIVPHDQLPLVEQLKDALFKNIVAALTEKRASRRLRVPTEACFDGVRYLAWTDEGDGASSPFSADTLADLQLLVAVWNATVI
jgi:hypothetical protein